MKRTLLNRKNIEIPDFFAPYISGATLYDSSCSRDAKVIFIDKGCGYYLKSAPKGALFNESLMADYFHKKGLSCATLEYVSLERDYLLTERVPGEDCTYKAYLDEPKRLAGVIGESLAMLHSLDFSDCPIKKLMSTYLTMAEQNHQKGLYDLSFFHSSHSKITAEDVWRIAADLKGSLKSDTLIHGDYCLPNIMLDRWRLSGFIDLGCGGVGDKHIDLFWGAWTLNFNLKTDRYSDVFFDAYGRGGIDFDLLSAIGAIECFR